MNRLSPHVTLQEAIHSQTADRLGIDNRPNPDQIIKLMITADAIYEPVRERFGPVYISSFFRCLKLNRAIGSKDTSQHVKCEAIDLDADAWGGVTNYELACWIRDNLEFDQLIFEGVRKDGTGGWIHISFRHGGNRQMVLSIPKP